MTRKTAITVAMIALCATGAAADDASERPVIVGAKVYVTGKFVVSDLASRKLLSERIAGTVQSGLPAVVELLFSLMSGRDMTVNRGVLAYELSYDVWEDLYMISDVDSTRYFSSFAQMRSAIENLERIAIVPVAQLSPAAEYSLRFSVAVHPLRSREQRRIAGWFGETVGGGPEGSKKQLLNLNDLIRHFFNRERDAANRSEWFETELFRPQMLNVPEGEDE